MNDDNETEKNIKWLQNFIDSANAEVARLRAENMELRLRNANLAYYIKAKAQARMN